MFTGNTRNFPDVLIHNEVIRRLHRDVTSTLLYCTSNILGIVAATYLSVGHRVVGGQFGSYSGSLSPRASSLSGESATICLAGSAKSASWICASWTLLRVSR